MSLSLVMRGRYYKLLFIEKEANLIRRSDLTMSQGFSVMEAGPDPRFFFF
jgi:hypothetical protein